MLTLGPLCIPIPVRATCLACAAWLLLATSGLAQPTASAWLIPPGPPAPAPEPADVVNAHGPRVSGDSSVSSMWTCSGYAAAPESWLTVEADLTLWLDQTLIKSGTFNASWSGQYGEIAADVAPAGYSRTLTCQIEVYCPYGEPCGFTSASDTTTIAADCGDERTNIIEEYRAGQVAWTPGCNDFQSSGGSAHFSWDELNGGFSTGNPHSPWGIIRSGLTSGLESTRTNYNRGGIRLSSGYRCPHGNAAVGGVQQSLHMHGRAADMYSVDHTWTEDEFNLMRAAASQTSPAELLYWNSYTDHHLHGAW